MIRERRLTVDSVLRLTLIGIVGVLSVILPTPSVFLTTVRAAEAKAEKLTSLSVSPEEIVLRGADRGQQLIVTGNYGDGSHVDLTTQAAVRVADPRIAQVDAAKRLSPLANGSTSLIAEFQGQSVSMPITVA